MTVEAKGPPDTLGPLTPQQRESLRAWVQMLRTYAKAQHRMSQVFRRHGLTSPQFDILATLQRGEGLMQQDLATRLLVTKGNVCGVLDRMEAGGWIERRPDPDDRRTNRIYLTESGRKIFAETLPDHHALVYETMGTLQSEEAKTLQRLLKVVEEATEG